MSLRENLEVIDYWSAPDNNVDVLADHVLTIGTKRRPYAEVEVREVGVVKHGIEFSTVRAQRVGFGVLQTVERLITPPLREKDEIESEALRVASELFA